MALGGALDIKEELQQAEISLRDLADRMIRAAQSTDAWTDYSMEKSSKGIVTVAMTGYIPKLNKYRLTLKDEEGLPNQLEPINSQFNVDPDTDGLSNLIEFAFLLDLLVPSGSPIPLLQGSITFNQRQDAKALVYQLQASKDLSNCDNVTEADVQLGHRFYSVALSVQ